MTSTPSDPVVLRSVSQAARWLGVSVPTTYRLLRTKQLQGVKVGGQWRIPESALRRFVENQISIKIERN